MAQKKKAARVPSRAILPCLVIAQLFGTSLWFSASAVLPALKIAWGLSASDGGLLVSAVQFGFISGTLVFALTNLSDLLSASKVFLTSAVLGAAVNVLFAYFSNTFEEALIYRFLTGLALAGVYPVGMKVVVSWSAGGIGNALGWLIGALTVGSASPYLLAFMGADFSWQSVMMVSSSLAVVAGLIVAWIGDGPYLGAAKRLDLRMVYQVFRFPGYRRAALGYFGHMWELYAFWVLAPLLVAEGLRQLGVAGTEFSGSEWVSLGAFAVIAIGAVGCIGGGLLSGRFGSRMVASVSLAVSGAMCLLAPFLLNFNAGLFLLGLLLWGIFVVSDSAQFSALSVLACPPRYVGTALTVQNSIGFAITIISIEWAVRWYDAVGVNIVWLLAPGPLLGLLLLNWKPAKEAPQTWDDEPFARGVEDVIASPLQDFAAPERSGGPSLF